MTPVRSDRAPIRPPGPSWAIGAGSYLGTPSDLVRFGLALRAGDSVFAPAALTETGEPTGRALGGWVMDSSGTTVRMLGSTWNGSFGLAIDLERGIVVAIASNIEFDQPGDLVDAILAACGPLARPEIGR